MHERIIKEALLEQCREFVQQAIDVAEKMMRDAQESANNETKSSAGDKYETGRAMMQAERDKYARRLAEANQTMLQLNQVRPAQIHDKVTFGSLVKTSLGNYFISISAGRVSALGEKYFAISPQAPLAREMMQKQAGDELLFNDRKIKILEVN